VATTLTSATNFDKTVTALVLRTVMENLRKRAVWLDEGAWMKGSMIPGTNLIRYINYGDLSSATQALTEATPPSEEALTIGYEEFAASQYGRLVGISDIALMQSPHDLMGVAAERIAFNAISTLDRAIGETIRDYLTSPVQILANARASRAALAQASSDYMISALVRRAVTELRAANVPTFPDGTYHGIIHPFVARDLMEESGTAGQWMDIRKYGGPAADELLKGEVGTIHGVRFAESNSATYIGDGGAASAHIFRTVIYGPGYFAFGDQQSIEAYMVRPGGDHTDPLAQKALVGWKAMWGAKVLGLAGVGPRFRGIDTVSSAAAAG
jgi:N4-gp56 family major capsid protein